MHVQVRPFRLATGTMLLQPLSIGAGARVCLQSAVAPGSAVPDGAVLGPLSRCALFIMDVFIN